MSEVRYVFMGMGPRRQLLLATIAEFIDAHGYSPSLRELQLMCDIPSGSTVAYNLDALERVGFIQRDREIARSIRMTDTGRDALVSMARAG